jgi:glycosyltransferase involved in cell wall biosynthesis
MNLCWLIPDDRGGGTAAVALSCCRQAARAGHDVTLLMALPPTGHLDEHVEGFEVASLDAASPYQDVPERLINWLDRHPQEVLFLNGCREVEPAIPHIPQNAYVVDVIHDTAQTSWQRAVSNESSLDAIVAVSDTVAHQFRDDLEDPSALHVLHNGTVFPDRPASGNRPNDLLFIGGSKSFKGARDVLDVWPALIQAGFDGRLHWFGGLDHDLAPEVASLPDAERIVDHGRVPRSQIFERAGECKALLMLSRVEPFGMVTIEAMGMGAIPVAWDIDTGTREIVEDGQTGFFAPLGNAKEFAKWVLEACRRHDELRDPVIDVARNRFSEEAMWGRYAEFLSQLTTRSPVSRPQAGTSPPAYRPPTQYFQLLPDTVRSSIRSLIARSPTLGYWLRDWRGF